MKYALEFINSNNNIEILRYDTETRKVDVRYRKEKDYLPPEEGRIVLFREVSSTETEGLLQKIGDFRPQMMKNGEYNWVEGYVFMEELKLKEEIPSFMDDLLGRVEGMLEIGDTEAFVADYTTKTLTKH